MRIRNEHNGMKTVFWLSIVLSLLVNLLIIISVVEDHKTEISNYYNTDR